MYPAAGLISARKPNFLDQEKAGTLKFTRACSNSFHNLSTLCLICVGGHSVILVKVFLITTSYVICSHADLLADVMAF